MYAVERLPRVPRKICASDSEWRQEKEVCTPECARCGFTADQVLADAEAEFVRSADGVLARQPDWHPGAPLSDDPGRRAAIQKVLEAIGKEHGRRKRRCVTPATVERQTFIRKTTSSTCGAGPLSRRDAELSANSIAYGLRWIRMHQPVRARRVGTRRK